MSIILNLGASLIKITLFWLDMMWPLLLLCTFTDFTAFKHLMLKTVWNLTSKEQLKREESFCWVKHTWCKFGF